MPATMTVLSRIGRSLMLPIAALPPAAILHRVGQDDLLGRTEPGARAIEVDFHLEVRDSTGPAPNGTPPG